MKKYIKPKTVVVNNTLKYNFLTFSDNKSITIIDGEPGAVVQSKTDYEEDFYIEEDLW